MPYGPVEKHRPDCPAPSSNYRVECICPQCEVCNEPAQNKKDSLGLSICDECWPHLIEAALETDD